LIVAACMADCLCQCWRSLPRYAANLYPAFTGAESTSPALTG
jgi:hypothetical protein